MDTSSGCSDTWDRLDGQALVMIGLWFSRQPLTNHKKRFSKQSPKSLPIPRLGKSSDHTKTKQLYYSSKIIHIFKRTQNILTSIDVKFSWTFACSSANWGYKGISSLAEVLQIALVIRRLNFCSSFQTVVSPADQNSWANGTPFLGVPCCRQFLWRYPVLLTSFYRMSQTSSKFGYC